MTINLERKTDAGLKVETSESNGEPSELPLKVNNVSKKIKSLSKQYWKYRFKSKSIFARLTEKEKLSSSSPRITTDTSSQNSSQYLNVTESLDGDDS